MKTRFSFLFPLLFISMCLYFLFGFNHHEFLVSSTYSDNYYSTKDSTEPPDAPAVPTYGMTDIANMYNERGFYKSNGFSIIEQEIINDFNGNLMYQIPLYNYKLAGDLNFNLSLNYNGSVGEQFIIGNPESFNSGAAGRLNANAPEWVFSLNGIAIQTLNYENSFFTNKVRNNQIKGDSVVSLIPGYHYDGGLVAAESSDPYDRIHILAGDGSLISLVNKSMFEYQGDYVSENKETYYKAEVSIFQGPTNGYGRRLVKLLKGDGTVYVFREYKRNFYGLDTGNVSVNSRKKPLVLLLEEIRGNTR